MTKIVTLNNVPAEEKDNVVAEFEDDGALFVNCVQEDDGEFTVIAIYSNSEKD
ncbi:hypothetical protein [Acinetobacter calcoaceticus]|uniref:hypothetical protein n=1 Tax=Acinetobacter calcoaceticus TaxID=471 RepID=UPI000F99565E|nr:hypothetical protein [Acinetobacter calcoaceticus]WNY29653.1 hypothetical protein Q4S33_10620 [Acinetobacter calcoaceticus]